MILSAGLFFDKFTNRKILLFIIVSFFAVSLLINTTVQAQCNPTSSDPMGCLNVIKSTSGYGDGSVQQILVNILNASLSLLFLIVLGFLIYGGYFWMTSMGNEERIKKSKQILTASIIGLIIVLSSLSIVNFISDALDITPQGIPGDTGLFDGTLSQVLTSLIQAALTLVGVISLGIMVYGGFRWMTSGGSEETISEAKRTVTAGAIGIIIIIISYSVVYFIISKLVAPT